jgi:hypothetical protein
MVEFPLYDEIPLYDDDEFLNDEDFLDNFSEETLEERFISLSDDDDDDDFFFTDDEDLTIFRKFIREKKDQEQISGLNLPELSWCDFKPSEEIPSFLNTEEFPSMSVPPIKEKRNGNYPFSVNIRFVKDEQSFRRKKMVLQIGPKKCPNNFRCKNDNCPYHHSPKTLCFSVKEGIPCVYGKNCNFFHPVPEKKVPLLPTPEEKVPLLPTPEIPKIVAPVAPVAPVAQRKHILCKKMFSFEKDKMQVMNCRFENRCIFAHSVQELEENLHQCKNGCQKIRISIRIIERNGQFKKISEVENVNSENKCLRIHPGEKIKCYIRRMYLK